jgi:hypothetical protein
MKTRLLLAIATLATLATLETSLAQSTPIISTGASWQVLSPLGGVDPDVADTDFNETWFKMDGSYNGPAFTTLATPMAYGGITAFAGKTVSVIPDPGSGNRYTVYLKMAFTTTETFANVNMNYLADDGMIVYIDGVRVARPNMTLAAADDFFALTDAVGSESTYGNVSLGPLEAGDHVIAISLHNQLATSSDLGFDGSLVGTFPPVLKTRLAGVTQNILPNGTSVGFVPSASRLGSWLVNASGAVNVLTSNYVDLSTTGEVFFIMNLYCYDVSGSSNFEAPDEFSAKLEYLMDDNSGQEVQLITGSMDPDGNNKLTGGTPVDEFNLGNLPFGAAVTFSKFFAITIPANVQQARLVITAGNDSPNEYFRFGDAFVTDVSPFVDSDADGHSDALELTADTSPTDFADRLRLTNWVQTATPQIFSFTVAVRPGLRYAWEVSSDLLNWEYYGSIQPTTTSPTYPVDMTDENDAFYPKFFGRIVLVP